MEHTRGYLNFGLVIQVAMSFKEKVYGRRSTMDDARWTKTEHNSSPCNVSKHRAIGSNPYVLKVPNVSWMLNFQITRILIIMKHCNVFWVHYNHLMTSLPTSTPLR